jgi:hypothetical protein
MRKTDNKNEKQILLPLIEYTKEIEKIVEDIVIYFEDNPAKYR